MVLPLGIEEIWNSIICEFQAPKIQEMIVLMYYKCPIELDMVMHCSHHWYSCDWLFKVRSGRQPLICPSVPKLNLSEHPSGSQKTWETLFPHPKYLHSKLCLWANKHPDDSDLYQLLHTFVTTSSVLSITIHHGIIYYSFVNSGLMSNWIFSDWNILPWQRKASPLGAHHRYDFQSEIQWYWTYV